MSTATILREFKQSVKLSDAPTPVIKAVQQQLVAIKLLNGKVDGIAGPLTRKAFADFKKTEYLAYPDLLGATTAIALLEATENHAVPQDDTPPVIALPGSVKKVQIPTIGWVTADQPIYPGSSFSWGEATKTLTRLPVAVLEVQNIIKTARHLDKAKVFLGGYDISITSWLRPLAINRAVFGAAGSRHIYGDGVDFRVNGISPFEVYDRLNEWHSKNGGLGKSGQFTHLDCRGGNFMPRWCYSK